MEPEDPKKKEPRHDPELEEADEDELTSQKLQDGLHKLDELYPAFTPSPSWFDQQIVETKNSQRSRLWGDLLKLWLAALLLLFVLYMTVTAQPVVFVTFQALAVVAPLAWLLIRKQEEQHHE